MVECSGRSVVAGYSEIYCRWGSVIAGGGSIIAGGSYVAGRDLLLREGSMVACCWRVY